MLRNLFVAVALGAVALPPGVGAEETGRYELTASAAGFIRLDTRTGATSHCTVQDGVWRCQPVIEAEGALAERIAALAERVDELAASVDALRARVDGASASLKPPPAPPTPEPGEPAFLASVIDRLLAVVGRLKHGAAGEG